MYMYHSIVCYNESVLITKNKKLGSTENKNFIIKQDLL